VTALEFVAWYLAAVAGAWVAVLVIAWRSRRRARQFTTITINPNGLDLRIGLPMDIGDGQLWWIYAIDGTTVTLKRRGTVAIGDFSPRRTS
jgi:hypothetical protein